MSEINLLESYPERKRNIKKRLEDKTPEKMEIARQFGWEYFDKKGYSYEGYSYDERWIPIAKKLIKHYGLKEGDKVLDLACAKGYLVYDLVNLGIDAYGIDISEYAIGCSPPEIRDRLKVRDVRNLYVYGHEEFDLVTVFGAIENLPLDECKNIIREIQRISKNAYIRLDAYRNEEERKRMEDWAFTAITYLHVDDWKKVFEEVGYTKDYYWFWP